MSRSRSALLLTLLTVFGLTLILPSAGPVLAQDRDAPPPPPTYLNRRPLTQEEHRQVWRDYIPALAGYNTITRQQARVRIVAIGLPVVRHLVTALDSRTLLPALHDNQALAPLRDEIERDLQAWYTRHADEFKGLSVINSLITRFNAATTGEEIIASVRAFWDEMNRAKETVPRPQVLNSIRAFAALAIGEIGDRTAGPQVARLIEDDAADVVGHSMEAMGRLLAPVEQWTVIYPFVYHDSPWLRSKAWGALRRMDARPAVDKLLDDFQGNPDRARRERIVQALEAITMQNFGEAIGSWVRWWSRERNRSNPLDIEYPRPDQNRDN